MKRSEMDPNQRIEKLRESLDISIKISYEYYERSKALEKENEELRDKIRKMETNV